MIKKKFKFIITTLLLIFLFIFYGILRDELRVLDTLKVINLTLIDIFLSL